MKSPSKLSLTRSVPTTPDVLRNEVSTHPDYPTDEEVIGQIIGRSKRCYYLERSETEIIISSSLLLLILSTTCSGVEAEIRAKRLTGLNK